jgi:hypothetical protein
MEKKAEYQISSSVKKGILEIILKGEATESNYEELTNKLTAIIKAKGVNSITFSRWH